MNRSLLVALVSVVIIAIAGGVYYYSTRSAGENNTGGSYENQNNDLDGQKANDSGDKIAADKNPGESINPPDKDEVKESDVFRYKLLDARTSSTDILGTTYPVVLIKLEVENISKWTRNLSVVEVRTSTAQISSVGQSDLVLRIDVAYPRSELGLDLAGDVTEIEPGEKVVGYYSYTLPDTGLPDELYFNILNLGNPESEDEVDLSKLLKIAGTFKLK